VGRLVSIVYTPRDRADRPQDHYVRVPLDRARLVENGGIEGDAKGRPGVRQINIMVAEVLDALRTEGFKTAPGELGEQLIVSGVDPASLAAGTRLRIGEAVVEVTIPRTGCARFEMIQGKSKASVAGRLGVMARVVVGGEAGVGDGVELLPAPTE
jgi:MOSC domain-containing protein YiiM